jgi:hypothetical protein
MRSRVSLIAGCLVLAARVAGLFAAEPVTITVHAGKQQTFNGFG